MLCLLVGAERLLCEDLPLTAGPGLTVSLGCVWSSKVMAMGGDTSRFAFPTRISDSGCRGHP